MRMRTIAIANEKGGTGKTTTAVCLAAALARRRRVLLVDLDGQAAASRWLAVENDTRLADALRRGGGLVPIPGAMPGVALAPGCAGLDAVSHGLRPTQGGRLRALLAELDGYDVTIIDCPPGLANPLIGNALLAADLALIPVECSILALDGLRITLDVLDDVRADLGHDIALAGVLAVRVDGRTRLSGEVLDELRRALGGKLLRTVIRENVTLRECPSSGKSILDHAPGSRGAEDYARLAREVEKKL